MDLNEQNFVNVFRAKINNSISPLIDSFSGWLIGGFGAASALIVSNFDSVSNHLNVSQMKEFLYYLIAALALSVIQKFISCIVVSNSIGTLAASQLFKEATESSINLNYESIFSEFGKSLLPFSRRLMHHNFSRIKCGDFVSSSRIYVLLCQIQGIIATAQAVVTLIAIYNLASGFES